MEWLSIFDLRNGYLIESSAEAARFTDVLEGARKKPAD
jgi:hypothetical protein